VLSDALDGLYSKVKIKVRVRMERTVKDCDRCGKRDVLWAGNIKLQEYVFDICASCSQEMIQGMVAFYPRLILALIQKQVYNKEGDV
jgi:hypothetical protein